MWSYLCNHRLKQANLVDFRIIHPFSKTGVERCEKRNIEDESILYTSTELSVD